MGPEEIIALGKAIIWIGTILYSLWAIFTPAGRTNAQHLIENVFRGLFAVITPLLKDLPIQLQPIVNDFHSAFTAHGGSLQNTLLAPFEDLAKAAFKHVSDRLLNQGHIEPAGWLDSASNAMGDAFGFGMSSFGVSAAFEAVLPEKLNVLNGAGPMLATMAGFAEVTGAALGPLLNGAIKQPATYDVNSKLRPHLPDLARALELHARRLITDSQLDTLIAFNGLNADWANEVIASSYRPIQPRALAAVIGEYNFDRDKVVELMRFAGYRDVDIGTFIDALVQRGLQPLRQAVINETVTLAGQGLLSDSDVSSTLDAQNLSDEAKNLINQRIALLRLHTMATLTKAEVVAAAKNELISLDQLAADLSSAGYQDAEVQIIRASVDQYLTAKEARLTARELSQEEARVQQITIREAQESYKRGEIDGAVFAAELAAAGVPVKRIAALTGLAGVLNEPTLKPGTKLSAYALKQQSAKFAIKALTEEFKKGQIDDATLRAGLLANGMSAADTEATINYLNALGIKTTTKAPTVPLAGSTNGTAAA